MLNAERCKFVMCDYEFVECNSIGIDVSNRNKLGVGSYGNAVALEQQAMSRLARVNA